MSLIISITTLLAALASLLLLVRLVRSSFHMRRHTILTIIVALFLLFHVLLSIALAARELAVHAMALRGLEITLSMLLAACAWVAAPLTFEKPNKWWPSFVVLLFTLSLGLLQFETGFFSLSAGAGGGNGVGIAFTPGGKFALAFMIAGGVLLLSRFEVLSKILADDLGGRPTTAIAYTLSFFIIATIVLCSDSLVYGRIRGAFVAGFQVIAAIFCGMLAQAMKRTPAAQAGQSLSKIRLTQFFSSEALIFGGAYLVAYGLLIKLAVLLGGSWHQFVSSLAAIGALVMTLLFISGTALRDRWARFIDRNLQHRTYDFRTELQSLTEAIATALDLNQLLLALSQSMTEIFSARRVCLLVADHDSSEFRVYALPRQGTAEEAAPLLGLSAAQLAWAQRAERSFSPEEFLALPEQDHNHAALRKLLAGLGYELGIALHAGQHLIGFVFLGSRTNHAPFSAEDRLLFETLTPAASISISSMRLRQQMIQAQQMESLHRVTSFIMHDLRNAVSTLTVLTYNVKKQLDQVGLQADFVVILDRLSSEMRHLINKLSDSNAGNELQDRGHCDPTQLLSEVLFDLQPPSQIKVTTVIPGLPAAFWNQRQIRVVLRNILANALEAMPSGGELEVVARYQTPFIIISIKDTGVGMPAEFIRDFLFRPNHSTKSRGLGIGLYQSREIVLAHRGTIHVQSQLGQGTTFEVHLPCTDEGVGSDQVKEMSRIALPVAEHQVSISQQELERNSLNGSWPACPQRGRPALATAA